MEEYSDNITKSLKILALVHADISSSISLLDENNLFIKHLAMKSLYIDLCSFIDELNAFVTVLHKDPFIEFKPVNEFLLLSHSARKILTKKDTALSNLRNTIFAHNYRGKSKQFVDPLEAVMADYKDVPLFTAELKYLGEVANIIASLATQCFNFNSDIAYSEIKKLFEEFDQFFKVIKQHKDVTPKYSIKELQNDISQIIDSLNSHDDNYMIISKKLKCKIRS